jgi:hypothetical protein
MECADGGKGRINRLGGRGIEMYGFKNERHVLLSDCDRASWID